MVNMSKTRSTDSLRSRSTANAASEEVVLEVVDVGIDSLENRPLELLSVVLSRSEARET